MRRTPIALAALLLMAMVLTRRPVGRARAPFVGISAIRGYRTAKRPDPVGTAPGLAAERARPVERAVVEDTRF